MKKILIFLMLIILSGCTVEYELLITHDKKFIEKINVNVPRSDYPGNDGAARRSIEQFLEHYKTVERSMNRYQLGYKLLDEFVSFDLQRSYNDFGLYKGSKAYRKVFKQVEIEENEFYQIRAKDLFFDDYDLVSPDWRNDLIIKLRFHNKVEFSNADEIDEITNTYVWYFNEKLSNEGIQVDLSKSIRYDIVMKDYFVENYVTIISVVVVVGSVGWVYRKLVISETNRNEI